MFSDITLGQYYNENSIIHRLDPRVKLVGTVLFMVSLFIFNNYVCYGIALLFLISVIAMSKVPVKFMLKGMKSIIVLILITVIYNLFMTPGKELVRLWIFKITIEGIFASIYMFTRLTFLIIGSSIMTLTTTPNQLTDGIERLFNPLKIFKVPVHEMAMMMSIALRFIPILMEELDKITKAQIARGADLESKNLFKKIKGLVPILVPLFISSFRRANDLALAMDARGYHGGDGRTKLKPLKYKGRDIGAYIVMVLYLGLVVVGGILFGRFLA